MRLSPFGTEEPGVHAENNSNHLSEQCMNTMCVCVCVLQPRPCAQLNSSAAALGAASGCRGDAMASPTAPTGATRRVVRKLVSLSFFFLPLSGFSGAKYNAGFTRRRGNS